jgi:hypothetical protein
VTGSFAGASGLGHAGFGPHTPETPEQTISQIFLFSVLTAFLVSYKFHGDE